MWPNMVQIKQRRVMSVCAPKKPSLFYRGQVDNSFYAKKKKIMKKKNRKEINISSRILAWSLANASMSKQLTLLTNQIWVVEKGRSFGPKTQWRRRATKLCNKAVLFISQNRFVALSNSVCYLLPFLIHLLLESIEIYMLLLEVLAQLRFVNWRFIKFKPFFKLITAWIIEIDGINVVWAKTAAFSTWVNRMLCHL